MIATTQELYEALDRLESANKDWAVVREWIERSYDGIKEEMVWSSDNDEQRTHMNMARGEARVLGRILQETRQAKELARTFQTQ